MIDAGSRETDYVLTSKDAADAGRDSMRWRLKRPSYRLLFWGGGLLFMAYSVKPDVHQDWAHICSDILAALILWLLIYYGVTTGTAFISQLQMRKWFAQNRGAQAPLHAAWTDDWIKIASPRGHWTYDWGDFVGWGVSDRMCRLYTTDRQMILIPARALTPSQRDDIIARLEASGSPRR